MLARCQDASGDNAGALLEDSPTTVIAVLYGQVSRGGRVPHDLVARLLTDPPASTGDPAFQLSVLAFGYISGLARENDPATSAAYAAFLYLARLTGPRADPVRSALAWNVVMSFVDTGALADARTAVADVAELSAAHPEEPQYTVEYGKCAIELVSALWNSGRQPAARDLALAADTALRSTHYLRMLAHIQNHP
jgi:hypothetical protein